MLSMRACELFAFFEQGEVFCPAVFADGHRPFAVEVEDERGADVSPCRHDLITREPSLRDKPLRFRMIIEIHIFSIRKKIKLIARFA